MEPYISEILEKILAHIDEGVHVINNEGKTIIYNNAMVELEGMDMLEVVGKPLLEVFPSLDKNSSTLLRVLRTEEKLVNHPQTYLNNHNKEIITINTTLPIYLDEKKVGALEIAKNITKIKELSDQIMSLQMRLFKPANPQLVHKRITFENIISQNKIFLKAIEYAKKACNSSSSVLIYGETGTGKELIAQSIYNGSYRSNKPIIAQNCAALPETLLEGILFGTVKGGFTGAIDRPGLFEQANGGVMFLDEINSMGIHLQSKLLRVLQEGTIRRLGGLKDIPIDVRIIASTNEEPYQAIENGNLRKDLFYRLNVISIMLPPLRERKDDIEILIHWFIEKYNVKLNRKVKGVDESILDSFINYRWPGNVRELENVVESAMNIIENEEILKREHFSPQVNAKIFAQNSTQNNLLKTNLTETLEEFERNILLNHLAAWDYNISKTANALGIKRQTLQHKLKRHNIRGK